MARMAGDAVRKAAMETDIDLSSMLWRQETKLSCTKRGIVYETTCLDCEEEAKRKESRGEVGLS